MTHCLEIISEEIAESNCILKAKLLLNRSTIRLGDQIWTSVPRFTIFLKSTELTSDFLVDVVENVPRGLSLLQATHALSVDQPVSRL